MYAVTVGKRPESSVISARRIVRTGLACHVSLTTFGRPRTVPATDVFARLSRERRSFGWSSGFGSGMSTGPGEPAFRDRRGVPPATAPGKHELHAAPTARDHWASTAPCRKTSTTWRVVGASSIRRHPAAAEQHGQEQGGQVLGWSAAGGPSRVRTVRSSRRAWRPSTRRRPPFQLPRRRCSGSRCLIRPDACRAPISAPIRSRCAPSASAASTSRSARGWSTGISAIASRTWSGRSASAVQASNSSSLSLNARKMVPSPMPAARAIWLVVTVGAVLHEQRQHRVHDHGAPGFDAHARRSSPGFGCWCHATSVRSECSLRQAGLLSAKAARAAPGTPERPSTCGSSVGHRHGRVGQQGADVGQELRALLAVDHAVVEAQRQLAAPCGP